MYAKSIYMSYLIYRIALKHMCLTNFDQLTLQTKLIASLVTKTTSKIHKWEWIKTYDNCIRVINLISELISNCITKLHNKHKIPLWKILKGTLCTKQLYQVQWIKKRKLYLCNRERKDIKQLFIRCKILQYW